MTTTLSPVAESIDCRLSALKEKLNEIYEAQEELLRNINPELRQDFLMTRADRIRELTEVERENHWLLSTWVVSG